MSLKNQLVNVPVVVLCDAVAIRRAAYGENSSCRIGPSAQVAIASPRLMPGTLRTENPLPYTAPQALSVTPVLPLPRGAGSSVDDRSHTCTYTKSYAGCEKGTEKIPLGSVWSTSLEVIQNRGFSSVYLGSTAD